MLAKFRGSCKKSKHIQIKYTNVIKLTSLSMLDHANVGLLANINGGAESSIRPLFPPRRGNGAET